MKPITHNKIRLFWLLVLLACSLGYPAISAFAGTGFTPVTQCFRNAGATGWIFHEYTGTSGTPVLVNTVPLTAATGVDPAGSGWLRLTDNINNESGSAYYTLPINVTQLGIQAQFSYTAWGGTGADGISLFLFDGSTTPANFVQGTFGGGLGYCQQNNYGGSSNSSPSSYIYSGTSSAYKFGLYQLSGGISVPGLSNAVIGVGIDDYGNFANNDDRCSNFGENGRTNMNSAGSLSYGTIAVRGPGNGQNGYNWLADTNNTATPSITPTWYQTATTTRPTASQFFRQVLVNISPATVGSASTYTASAYWLTSPTQTNYTKLLSATYPGIAPSPLQNPTKANTGSTTSSCLASATNCSPPYLTVTPPSGSAAPYNSITSGSGSGIYQGDFISLPVATSTEAAWSPLPPTVLFGFAASTGGANNYHEIQDSYFTEGLPDLAITTNTYSESGGLGTFLVTVTNLGSTPATNATITTTINGLTNPLWSCIPSTGSSCPAASGAGALSAANFSLGIVGNITFVIKGQATTGTIVSDTVSVAPTFTGTSPTTGALTTVTDQDLTSNGACTSTASSTSTMTANSTTYTCTSSIGTGITTLNLSQLPQTSDSSADNTVAGGQVQTSTQVFVASYNSSNWWGGLASYNLVTSGSGSSAIVTGVASLANWDAGCKLTGGSCSTTGTSYIATTPSTRAILTWNGTAGLSFASVTNTLLGGADPVLANSSYQCTSSTGSTTACTYTDVLNYLSGVRTNEQGGDNSPGPFRTRTGVLGDIISSNPVYVGTPTSSYPVTAPWSDLLYPTTTMLENAVTNSYAAYQTAQATRMNVVYVASNDGMVHGFRSGSFTAGAAPTYVSTYNDGQEVLAYMPGTVLSQIAQNSVTGLFGANYNFTDPSYTHHFFVNGSPSTGDLYYSNAWHSWLVGGLAGGGKAIYALDVTTPANFSQANAASLVVKELNTANLTCTGTTSCVNDLGWTYGTPVITRMHNGTWAVIFGNGYNSTNGHATVFIASISSTGVWTVYDLQTNTQLPNGIAYVTPSDLDGDHITDYLYAGDLFGNLWRFDVTSSNPSNWGASNFNGASNPGNSGASASPIFTATNTSGIAQPISTQVEVVNNTLNGMPQTILMFGTGKNLEASDLLPDNTTIGVQSIYGVWDWNMSGWNALSSTKYASLSAPQTITRSVMQQQTVTGTYDGATGGAFTSASTSGYRTLSGATVCWASSTSASCSSNTQLGFYLDLPSLGEEILYNPIMVDGLFVVNTTIPAAQTQGLTCFLSTPPGGWTMAINPLNGGVLLKGTSIFNTSTAASANIGRTPVSGIFVSAVGTPSVVNYNNQTYLINKTSAGGVVVNPINPNTLIVYPTGKRLSWVELR